MIISCFPLKQSLRLTIARSVVEKAIGEHLDGTPLENPDKGENPTTPWKLV